MPELIRTPPSFYLIDEGRQPSTEHDEVIALAAVASLEFLTKIYPEDPEIANARDEFAELTDNVADSLVETGLWWGVTFDPDTNFAIETTPAYQNARLRWLQEDGAASNNGALRDMARTALHTLVDRAFSHGLQ